jgi:hypothetical protein
MKRGIEWSEGREGKGRKGKEGKGRDRKKRKGKGGKCSRGEESEDKVKGRRERRAGVCKGMKVDLSPFFPHCSFYCCGHQSEKGPMLFHLL